MKSLIKLKDQVKDIDYKLLFDAIRKFQMREELTDKEHEIIMNVLVACENQIFPTYN